MTDEPETRQKIVTFDYLKGPNFRSVRTDGVIGGITPNGKIHMAIYSERQAIPRRVSHELNDDGSLGRPTVLETRGSIVREMEVDIFMDANTARSILKWLGDMIDSYENRDREGGNND